VDSTDPSRFEAAAVELQNLAVDEQLMVWLAACNGPSSFSVIVQDVAIVVLANKSDMPGALSAEEVEARLELTR
jgi:signal recognition particle receptor subunit beta